MGVKGDDGDGVTLEFVYSVYVGVNIKSAKHLWPVKEILTLSFSRPSLVRSSKVEHFCGVAQCSETGEATRLKRRSRETCNLHSQPLNLAR